MRRPIVISSCVVLMALAAACSRPAAGPMSIQSSAFQPGREIPPQYTCDGRNAPPPLAVAAAPPQTKSLAFIVTDPDAPRGTFTHWIVWNISPSGSVQNGTAGTNDFGLPGYGGPCPPAGAKHRYVFTVYALDLASLPLTVGARRAELEAAMRGHVVGQAELIGRYQRP